MDLLPSPLKRYYCLLLLFSLSWASRSVAQNTLDLTPTYSFKHYTDENGLPQNSIKDITPDNEGFIWMTTENGLVRFDGQQFKLFNRSNLDISSNRFLWFQPSMDKSSGPLFTEVTKNEFVSIEDGKAKADKKYYKNWMTRIPNIQEGYLKITTPMSSPDAQRQMLTQEKYIVPVSQSNGKFYLCHPDELAFYKNWKKQKNIKFKFQNYWHIFRLGEHLAYLNKNYTITLFNGNSGLQTNLHIQGDILSDPLFSTATNALKIFWNNASDQVFLNLNKRLYALALTGSGTIHTSLLLTNFDPDAQGIRSIFHDRKSGRIFLGSWSKGLYVFTRQNFSTFHFPLKDNLQIFYGQAAINDSSILVPQGYSVSLDLLRKKTTVKKFHEIIKQSLYNFPILIDKQRYIWGNSLDSLTKFSTSGKKILKKWGVNATISILYKKKDGDIAIVTQSGKIYSLNPLQSSAPKLIFQKNTLNQCIGQKQDTLLVGTSTGLYKISPPRNKVTIVPGTEKLNVRSLLITKTDEIWLTTYENGVFLYQNNKLIRLPSDKNHFLDTSHCIVEDKNGYFWITTNKGLFQVLKSDLLRYAGNNKSQAPYYHYYSRESGFKTNEFNGGCQPCALRLGNGYVSLPSIDGLVLYVPERIKAEQPHGKLFIDDITVSGKPHSYPPDSLNLPFNPANVRISITTPYFGESANLNIFYAIAYNGATSDTWIPLDHDRVIELSNLPSGSHTLHLKKQNGFGIINETHTSFSINVEKSWYETTWFRILVTLGILAIVILFIKVQNKNLVRKNRLLEQAVNKRTDSLKQTLHALKDSENELGRQVRIQSRMIASLTHDVRSPLRAVTSISNTIDAMIREEKYELVSEIGKSIGDSTERIGTMLDSTLDYIKVQLSEKNIQIEKVNLHDLIGQKIKLFSLSSKKQDNIFINNIPTALSVRNNPSLLGIIMNNLLDNANKNTVHGIISIHCESDHDKLILKVSDTGYGIPDHLIQWLNLSEQDAPDMEHQYLKKVSGVGLIIVKETARMMGLTLLAERHENGSSVSIYLEEF